MMDRFFRIVAALLLAALAARLLMKGVWNG